MSPLKNQFVLCPICVYITMVCVFLMPTKERSMHNTRSYYSHNAKVKGGNGISKTEEQGKYKIIKSEQVDCCSV